MLLEILENQHFRKSWKFVFAQRQDSMFLWGPLKGLLEDAAFCAMIQYVIDARVSDPLEIVTVLAGTDFGFPTPEWYRDMETTKEGAALASCFKKMLVVLVPKFVRVILDDGANTESDNLPFFKG